MVPSEIEVADLGDTNVSTHPDEGNVSPTCSVEAMPPFSDASFCTESVAESKSLSTENGLKNDDFSAASLLPEEGVQIICAGLMRTGLMTLRTALECLGFKDFCEQADVLKSYALWDKVLHNRGDENSFPAIYENARVVMGMPTFCFWEQILERYPNALVILTVRDEDDWWQSVRQAKSLMDKDLPGSPLRYGSAMRYFERLLVPSYHRFSEILRYSWATMLGAHALDGDEMSEIATRSNYRRHNSYVKYTLSKRRTPVGTKQLLVYNVSQGWEPLCKFLAKPVPDTPFPAVMHVPYFGESQEANGETRNGDTPVLDRGITAQNEMDVVLLPDTEFGQKMRQELRRGLAVSLAVLTACVVAVFGVHMSHLVNVPVAGVALVYLALITAAFNAYVVMHGLVMRVPALVVLPLALKSLLIAAYIQACFITYGILKEKIVTQDKIASPVLILSSRLASVVMSSLALLVQHGRVSFGGAAFSSCVAFGVTNEVSTWAGYELLNFVSYPVQLMAKSCKLLPSMIIGRLLNNTEYSWRQYFEAAIAMICVSVMHLTDKGFHVVTEAGAASHETRTVAGITLLVVFFVSDSFTSQWQTAVYRKHVGISRTQMMLAGNLVGLAITLCSVLLRWGAVTQSLARAFAEPEVMVRILLLGLSGAAGQFAIYEAIKVLGPLSFSWIMTSRQLFAVVLSLVVFGHGLTVIKLLCILVVFGIMSAKQLSRMPQVMRQCSGCKARSSRADQRAFARLKKVS
eukprot:TRINITY_DN44911_c0_g1_i1.p1 TRINITY_DN44911_c0_g1~~TRINITY_DN44911_c0_g1_i1.p1  ORF type:complete len:746 (+),score=96.95 TRINITY_DN44911_c0_g1_i1:158-2395(+)